MAFISTCTEAKPQKLNKSQAPSICNAGFSKSHLSLHLCSEAKCSEMRCNGEVGNLNGVKPNDRVVKCSWVKCSEVE